MYFSDKRPPPQKKNDIKLMKVPQVFTYEKVYFTYFNLGRCGEGT
jgi:hypothetical protein